jgi:hypothetical protein
LKISRRTIGNRMIEMHQLDGIAALVVARTTMLKKLKGERDTEFVKRIVCAYINAYEAGKFLLDDVSGPLTGDR